MNYFETLKVLCGLLEQANKADSQDALSWQDSADSSLRSYYGHLWNAIAAIAGDEFLSHWADSGEWDWNLTNRIGDVDVMPLTTKKTYICEDGYVSEG